MSAGALSDQGDARARRADARPGRPDPDREAAERAGLRRVAAAVVSRADTVEALNLAAAEVASLMGAEQGFVFRLVEGDRVEIAGASGVEESPVGAVHALLETGVIPDVVRTHAPARVEGRERPLGRQNSDRFWIRPCYRAGIGAPVFVGDELWGALVAGRTSEEPFPPGAEDRLAYFAEIAGIAIGNAEANERLARLAMSDPLTGVANIRAFDQALDAEVARARRHGRPLALALIDIDHFKSVNDDHGHLVGDRALIEVARRLRRVARAADHVARVGGEEFAWILPETDVLGARGVAERARRAVGAEPVAEVGRITVSIGVAELAQAGGRAELYRLADEALYAAKRSGRDRSVAYDVAMALRPAPPARERSAAGSPVARSLSRAVDAKDPATRAHCERVARVVERMAAAAGWPPDRTAMLADAALVHEVGVIGVPTRILRAAGPLSEADEQRLRRHVVLGAEILADVMSPEQVSWVRAHAERWDGTGHPDGLAGDAIPDGARLIAVADRWDALTVGRPPREPVRAGEALEMVAAGAGTLYCPWAVDLLRAVVTDPAAAG